ncbi:unnamed protein product [Adineta steineri]|uniref:EF-hand domain-containing protein n=1 Tax=Adineta steineri TaxID=433720 RepID=A0A814LXI3_9BILA|nr:unnamed protein product [Adineta steineri]CAF3728862.1 unnamed protein product [Adineta steineri]
MNPSLISVDHHPISISSNDSIHEHDQIKRTVTSSSILDDTTKVNVRQCSLTQMLLVYAQQDLETSIHSDNILYNILNVLELHFNTYADDKQLIYFEGIFQILYDFKEPITELALIETMQLLQIDLLAPCTFENFILILCHLPPIKQDNHRFFNVFNELDHNKDSYITYEDIQYVLPHLTSHFDEEIIRATIHLIDTDHDNDHLSYFDFVTSLIVLQECKLTTMNRKKISMVSS